MIVSGFVRTNQDPAAAVAGAVVQATNLDTGQVDGEATTDRRGAYAIGDLRGDRYTIEVTPPSGYRGVAPEHVSRPAAGSLALTVDFALPVHAPGAGAVTAVPATGLIAKTANFFDLQGRTVTFTPDGEGQYAVETGSLTWVATGTATGRVVNFAPVVDPHHHSHGFGHTWAEASSTGKSTEVSLPFGFPFAGRVWTRVHVNRNGNVSFASPESTHWEQRDPWSNGTMRSVAAAVDSRSAAGLEAMIAVLWALYGETAVSVATSPAQVVITWDAFRHNYEPAGPNEFQVRLYPSGVIELAYRRVSERDGIVGLFHGPGARGGVLSAATDDSGDAPNATLDIISAELVDHGSTVIASVTMADDIPDRVSSGQLSYRFHLGGFGGPCAVGLTVGATGRRPDGCGPAPGTVGYTVQGRTLEIPISKALWPEDRALSWTVDAVWWGRDEWDHLYGEPVTVDASDHNLSSLTGTVAGNVFTTFHYPAVPKASGDVLSFVYGRVPANDEIAVAFTDFRFDDLFAVGAGSGPINAPVQGIGDWQANPRRGGSHRSDNLLTTMDPAFIGSPKWAETGTARDIPFRNFSDGVRWIAHEAVHRWAAHLRFRNPRSGETEPLIDDWCYCHWNEFLHAPAVYPVWPGFSDRSYSEASVMGGEVWVENGDGTFTKQDDGRPLATGLSALDLYVMGMMPADEVPDTFLLTNVRETASRDTVRATKVPVRIEDIVAALGPRVPSADNSRKEFRLGVYLLHEDGRPPRPQLLERARAVSVAISDYFDLATDGRMHVIPTGTSTAGAR